MQYLVFVILAPIAGLAVLFTLGNFWPRRNTVGARALMVYLVAAAGFLICNTLEVLDPTPAGTLFWAKLCYLFIIAIPVAWLRFALQFSGRSAWLAPGRFWMFYVMPVITLLLLTTTEQHGLVWSGYRFLTAGRMMVIQVEHGPWFWFFGLYMYSSLFGGALVIWRAYAGGQRIYRRQSLWAIAGGLIPLLANLVYVLRPVPNLRQDFSSIAFALSGLVFAHGIFKHRLLNLAPVARTTLVDTMPDGLLVLDPGMRVVDLNPAACKILGLALEEDLVGRCLGDLWAEADTWPTDPLHWPEVVRVDRPGMRCVYGMRAAGLGTHESGQRGWLIVLSDVTRRANAEEALELANQSLGAANAALRRLNEELEARIAARTVALTQRAQELEALARVSSVLRKADGLEALLNILLEETVAVMEASGGAVFLLEEDDLVLSAAQYMPALPGARLAPCADPLWRVMDMGVALHLSAAALAQEPASEFFRSLVGRCNELSIAPVHAANRILGLLLLVYDRPLATLLEEYARLLTAIAEMVGNALQRVRMVENLETLVQARTRDLSALYAVTAASNLPLDLPDLLERVLATVVQVMGTPGVVLHLVEESGIPLNGLPGAPAQQGVWPAGRPALLSQNSGPLAGGSEADLDPGAVFEVFPLFLAAHIGLDTGSLELLPSTYDTAAPWVQVLLQRGIVVLPGLAVPIPAVGGQLSACVSVPVRTKGRILGVLSVLVESIGRFSAEDIALLAAISDHVGGAVERARLRQRAEEAAVIEERQRLARDLHDSVTQSLYSLVLFAEAGKDALQIGNIERASSHLDRLRNTSQQSLKEMRLLIYELHPLALQTEGLVGALRKRIESVERRAGIDARLVVENLAPLPDRIEAGLYGIAQEALNNVLKHSGATQLTLRLTTAPQSVEMEISDNGKGFLVNSQPGGGMGLSNMRARARALGGDFNIHSEPGAGTCILVKIIL